MPKSDFTYWFNRLRYYNIISLSDYTGYDKRIRVKCLSCGYIWKCLPKAIKRRDGDICPICTLGRHQTEDSFAYSLNIHNSSVKYIKGFKGMSKPCEFKCTVCGYIYTTLPATVKGGHSCPKCAGNSSLTIDEVTIWLKDNVPSLKYLGGYKGRHKDICSFECLKCGYFWDVTFICVYQGYRCPNCSGHRPLNESAIIKRLSKICPNIKYLSGYTKVREKCLFECLTCGNKWRTDPGSLRRRPRCPECVKHQSQPIGEKYIEQILKEKKVNYEYPKMFDDLKDKQLLHYDFYLPDENTLIEYQGEQHYYPVKHFGGKEKFEIQKQHDKLKKDYAKRNSYKLICIPYTASTLPAIAQYLKKK